MRIFSYLCRQNMKRLEIITEKEIIGSGATVANDTTEALVWFEKVRQHLQDGEAVEFSPKGYSMWPALRPATDTVRLRAATAYRRSDLVVARCGEPCGVFLHRIVEVHPDGVVLMGDSNLYQTERCGFADIAGKVTAVRRDGRDVTGSFSFGLLSRIQRLPSPLRRIFVRVVNLYLKHKVYAKGK